MTTFGTRMRDVKGFGPGFDMVRIVLAFSVVAWHAVAIAEGSTDGSKSGASWLFFNLVLPSFFALSGFLVTGSALRLPLREYILNRTYRIVPALAVDIGLSAIVLGAFFTTLSLSDYFTSEGFLVYFTNIFGWVHFELPGVFENNRFPKIVNGSLWTVPYEIACYVVMSLMIILGLLRSARATVALCVALLSARIIAGLYIPLEPTGFLEKILSFILVNPGSKLVPYFLCGSAFYLLREKIPFHWLFVFASVALGVAASLFLDGRIWFGNSTLEFIACVPATYIVVYFGLSNLPKPPIFSRGDYSYGVYLYHFPLLQAIDSVRQFPALTLFCASFVPLTVFAMLSWHLVEKPILKSRRRSSVVGAKIADDDVNDTKQQRRSLKT